MLVGSAVSRENTREPHCQKIAPTESPRQSFPYLEVLYKTLENRSFDSSTSAAQHWESSPRSGCLHPSTIHASTYYGIAVRFIAIDLPLSLPVKKVFTPDSEEGGGNYPLFYQSGKGS